MQQKSICVIIVVEESFEKVFEKILNSYSLLLSGPGVNKAVLLKIQQEREQERAKQNVDLSGSHAHGMIITESYDNKGYVDNETKREPRSRRSSSGSCKKVLEKSEGEKETRITNF